MAADDRTAVDLFAARYRADLKRKGMSAEEWIARYRAYFPPGGALRVVAESTPGAEEAGACPRGRPAL